MIPPVHLVTDSDVLTAAGFGDQASALLRAGGARVALHLRGPELSGRRIFEIAERLVPVAREAGARVLVNDRVDVAIGAGADGVQLGTRSFPPAVARRLLGPEAWIGASVHSAAEAEAAAGADFLLAGTLYPSASHPGRPGRGVELVRELSAAGLPVVGIGGITAARVAEVRGAGAAGVAVLGAVWRAPGARAALEHLLEAWEGA